MRKTIFIALFVLGLIFHFSINDNSLIAQTGTGGGSSTQGSCDIGTQNRYKSKVLTNEVATCGSCLTKQIVGYEKLCDGYYRVKYGDNVSVSATYNRVECISITVGDDEDENSSCTQVFATDFNCPSAVIQPGVVQPPGTVLDGTDYSPCQNGGTGTGTGF